jgi:hypothetical protein
MEANGSKRWSRRTVTAVQVPASTYGLTCREKTALKQQRPKTTQPPPPHNWRWRVVTVGQRWSAFLERISVVRR